MAGAKIDFKQMGIGAALQQPYRLVVPLNQREFSWREEHALALFEDLNTAISSARKTYFLGSIVLTRVDDATFVEVADGQQRLATTTMLLSAIRDYLLDGSEARARGIEEKYLMEIDLETEEMVPRLSLNVDDKDFFVKAVLVRPDKRRATATKASHRRIEETFEEAKKYVTKIVEPFKITDRAQRLIEWVAFLRDGAEVILLTVPDDQDAFMMFETLNDRGLRASQADLLKNYLLSKAGTSKITESQQRWARMLGSIDALDAPDMPVTYLRHVVICRTGATRERELFGKVKSTVDSSAKAMDFLGDLETGASVYSAIFNPEHVFWNNHPSVRGHVRTLLTLKVEQIRPLIFAAMQKFAPADLKAAFRLFVSWSVRFLIAGGGRGGVLDRNYGDMALAVTDGKFKTASQLAKEMGEIVPSDSAFEAAFADARVSQNALARYYLRALEMKRKDEADPETVPNIDDVINLEHVLPENPGAGWIIDPEIADAYWRRIGNMVLLKAGLNADIGNKPFNDKKAVLKASAYILTRDVAASATWGPTEIAARQAKLAKLAVETWPLKP